MILWLNDVFWRSLTRSEFDTSARPATLSIKKTVAPYILFQRLVLGIAGWRRERRALSKPETPSVTLVFRTELFQDLCFVWPPEITCVDG